MTNDDAIEWPKFEYVPPTSPCIANELVDTVGLPPPDGRYLFCKPIEFEIEEDDERRDTMGT